jgi:hypothetical protein
MPASIMYQEDHYTVLSPQMEQQFVNLAGLQTILKNLLEPMQDRLPKDLQKISSIDLQIERLIKTACELDCPEVGVWQWYVVRLEK